MFRSRKTFAQKQEENAPFYATTLFHKCAIGGGAVLLLILAFVLINNVHFYSDWTEVPSTCATTAYRYRTCSVCGKVDQEEFASFSPHDFGEWEVTTEATMLSYGSRSHSCINCGYKESESILPTASVPQLLLYGHGTIYTNSGLWLSGVYQSGDVKEDFRGHIFLDANVQPSAKYSYVLRSITSEQENSVFLNLFGTEASAYLIAGGNDDATGERFAAVTDLWSKVVSASNTDGIGTQKAMPVLLFINETYYGVFTLALPVSETTVYDLSEKTSGQRGLIYAKSETEASRFLASAASYSTPCLWADNSTYPWVYDSFNRMMDYFKANVATGSKAEMNRYLDVDLTIDYYLTSLLTGAGDNLTRSILWATSDGTRWHPTMTYPSCSLGLSEADEVPKTTAADNRTAYVRGGTEDVLWDSLLRYYPNTIRSRYAALRATVFTDENLEAWIDASFTKIPQNAIDEDNTKYDYSELKAPATASEFKAWVRTRVQAMDRLFRS